MKLHIISILSLLLLGFPVLSARTVPAAELEIAKKAVADAKAKVAPDKRQTICAVAAVGGDNGAVVVVGSVSEGFIKDAIESELRNAGVTYTDSITVIPFEWAQTRIPAASHRTGGKHAAEMSTQSVMGMPLRVLSRPGEFWQVQTPDGYIAYVPSSSVVTKTDAEMAAWRKAPRYVMTAPYQIKAFYTADDEGVRNVVTDLVNGSIVTVAGNDPTPVGGKLHIELPDGRTAYADAASFTAIEEWAAQEFNPDRILDIAYSMEGAPYLWGGTSTKALDCSGLAKVSYLANGIILMRDASQQALTGTRIEPENWRSCRSGDLLFFGNKDTGKVTHVAIYDHDGNYVHSSGRVKRNSVDPDSPAYLTTPFLHAVRIDGNEGTAGITLARNHPWYFDK